MSGVLLGRVKFMKSVGKRKFVGIDHSQHKTIKDLSAIVIIPTLV